MPRYFNENILKMQIREKFHTLYDFNDAIYADDLKTVIEQMPTADVHEVKHGKWINDFFNHYCCSECGAEASNDGYDCSVNYCYNCGAKMDGEMESNAEIH